MSTKKHAIYVGNNKYELSAMMNDDERRSREFSRWAETIYGGEITMPTPPLSSDERVSQREMSILENVARELYKKLGKKYNVGVRVEKS